MSDFAINTVDLSPEGDALCIVDQTLLPGTVKMLRLTAQKDIWQAIYTLQVRGAPAIGIAAAIGMYLAAKEIVADDFDGFMAQFAEKKAYLASARPTAVNLFWALDQMEACALSHRGEALPAVVAALRAEAMCLREEDIAMCKAIGRHGAPLIQPGMGVLTHCNAGALATVAYGTATAPIYRAKELGVQNFTVYCDETRPLLQGARLTAFELMQNGVDTCLLCDNMAASLMQQGRVQLVLVGADRIARNGDAANKIGTLGVAILAAHYGIPFYVCAPTSTIDMAMADGGGIEIEQRAPAEVTEMWYQKRMAPEGVRVYNPAFDVTGHGLITGIITQHGIAKAPYEAAFRAWGL
ncbi:MAG: S-methyl-5-thioribose-1-phosphate isomerase [Ruminococcaceae bacterium]|nr:S-methyl-5-thioribose-1-phosphate isomerase [Oscillospiraceae bacterium]